MALINRFSTNKNGSMIFTGNTLGLSNNNSDIGAFITLDNASQVPGFPFGTTLIWQDNGSEAQFSLPAGSTVLYAELQWGGNYDANIIGDLNTSITFTSPSSSYTISPDPITSQNGPIFYSRSQNVTSIIQNDGDGIYSVEGVPSQINSGVASAGWTLGIIYENSALPIQNMTIFSGIEEIGAGAPPVDFNLSGFLTPATGSVNGRVLLSAMEGDRALGGDQILFGPDVGSLLPLSGPNNIINNFFASQINDGDSESATVGQLDTSGTFGTINVPTNSPARYGWDITNVFSNNFMNNQTGAVVRLTSTGDGYAVPLFGVQLDAVFLDYGDAPDTSAGNGPNDYSTLLANNGPSHGIVNELYLGTKVTSEDDAYQDPDATGDDTIQSIQDDGVMLPVVFSEGTTIYSVDLSYTNNTGSNANIYAWIDFNRDGIFQLEEGISPISVSSSTTNPRTITLSFVVPGGTVLMSGDTTFMRIRITTDTLTNTNVLPIEEDTRSLGVATDGEVEDYLVNIVPEPSFLCEPTAYQVIAETNPNTGLPFNSQFRSIDPVTGEVTVINSNMGAIMNAIAYNPIDNYIYGIYDVNDPNAGNLARISADGVVTNLGPIPNLPNLNMTNGAIDNRGFFYLKNQADDEYFVVDLRSSSPNFGQLVDPTAGYVLATPPYSTPIAPGISPTSGDWVFNPVDNLLYTFASGQFYTIVPTSGVSSPIPTEAGFPGGYGGMFNGANGFIYGISNSTGDIIRWHNVGGTMDGDFFSVSGPAQRQDATMCIRASVLVDFGDAPDTSLGTGTDNYNTLLVSNGPRHGIVNGVKLGTKVTAEIDAYQNPTATGDDTTLGIQDDGVIFPLDPIVAGDTTYTLPITYMNDSGEAANIYAWIDFNRDGIFQLEEAAQPLGVASSISNPRVEELTFNIPAGSSFTPGDTTFIRVRITTDELNNSNLLPTQEDTRSLGPASDGEVEDYQVDIIELNVEGTIWYDLNCDGLRDISEPLAEGITVELYDSDNDAVPFAIDTTDINGFYTFPNLPSGNYYVKVILPNGYEYTLTNVGANDNIDSDVDKTNGESPTFTLDGNNQLEIVDAGLCKLNKISGQAFYDCDGNGILDFGEPYLCGVQVTLLDVNGFEIGTVITDCNGYYEFLNLPPGDYTVRVVAPPDMNYVSPVPGDFYGSKPDDITGEFGVTLTNEDYIQGFAGFKGNSTLDARYCTECEVCSEKNKYKSCRFGCNIYTNENGMIVCGENSNCSCESNCNCKNCNGTCVGCNTCKSNRTFNHNRVSCSQCDNSNNCNNCDDKKQDDNGCGCY
ncbi:SdrD B-like domain-containing protein [Clostridium sp. B9]|uniref:SdrD B-like domain-containing protein n=1 Tax=Clostridium sp. B9 TaxID=3423224 RepID=UPI003D2EDF55